MSPQPESRRIQGLDSIRFLCAVVVLLSHNLLFLENTFDAWPDRLANPAESLLRILFNGPAAVIVFFVVSGFCIHYPVTQTGGLNVISFYVRRFTRIAIPALAAAGLWWSLGIRPTDWNDTVMWSIFCEMIYYLAFPLLLLIRRRTGWPVLVALAYLAALEFTLLHRDELYVSKNPWLNAYVALDRNTWLIGLPCWLLGCWLAERYREFPLVSRSAIWGVRAGVFGVSVFLRFFQLHSKMLIASNCISLNVFALLVAAWIGLEIRYAQSHPPKPFLEAAGRWSYSLYLVHPAAGALVALAGMTAIRGGVGLPPATLVSFPLAYIFYLLAENPSHRLAGWLGRSAQPVWAWIPPKERPFSVQTGDGGGAS